MDLKTQVLGAQINPTVGDLVGNTQKILSVLQKAKSLKAELVVFPEMALTGYPPEDLLLDEEFIKATERQLQEIILKTQGLTVVLGTLRKNTSQKEKPLFNTAAIIRDGKLLGFQDKRLLPTYDVFDERRYFEPGKETTLWKSAGLSFAVLVCEDMWQHGSFVGETHYAADPVGDLLTLKPDLIIDISSSPYRFTF
jgi:NAD+ synthase (glutamine-hydrolysing)